MILITTAGGNVGQHVVKLLAQKKVPARAGFHSQEKASALEEPGVEGVVLDFENPESLKTALNGVTKMFIASPGSPNQGHHDGNLISAAKKAGVKQIVKLSGKIAEDTNVGFALWNVDAERKLREGGVPHTILRANYFMQNLLGFATAIQHGSFTMGPAAKRVAYLDTRDIAAVAVAALTEEGHVGKIYDINGPELLDGNQQAAIISSVLGRPVQYLDVSIADFVEQLKSYGMPGWLVEAFGAALGAPIPGDQSSATIEKILHRKPGTFEQFIKDYRSAFQA